MTTAVVLIITGVVIAFGSFIFALVNMLKSAKDFTKGKVGIAGLFVGHIGAMIGMAIGGLTTTIGIIWLIVVVVQHLMA